MITTNKAGRPRKVHMRFLCGFTREQEDYMRLAAKEWNCSVADVLRACVDHARVGHAEDVSVNPRKGEQRKEAGE